MQVIGHGQGEWADDHVHTVDVWFSQRRRCWVVERLNHHGDLIGAAHCATTLADAEHCLADWLRSHDEAYLTAPRSASCADGDDGEHRRAA